LQGGRPAGPVVARPEGSQGVAQSSAGQPPIAGRGCGPVRTLIFAGVAEAVGDAGATGRRGTVRRACVATRGCAATDQRWARAYSSARRQPAGASGAQGLCDIPALAAGRVVRATTRARRCGQAVAGAVLRRSPSAFQRYAESTAGAAGAGRTVDSLQ